ncbi:hypothetical protein JXB02_06370 [Candidatus Woesearchaeota archaeon]|nr:hypothetical protein [Candidatus Woesearchaeota archaeon]
MKMNGKLGLFALLLVGLVASAGAAYAFWGGGLDDTGRQAIQDAIDAGDYAAWKQAMEDTLTEERFQAMVEQHAQMQERQQLTEAYRTAMGEGDYDAYLDAAEALAGYRMQHEVLSEEDFDTLVQRHQEHIAEGDAGCGPGRGLMEEEVFALGRRGSDGMRGMHGGGLRG